MSDLKKQHGADKDVVSMATQIPMALPIDPGLEREDLLESAANQLAVDLVDCWPDWPSNTVILAGPVGSGKSHLSKIWAARAGAQTLTIQDLKDETMYGAQSSLVLEDIDSGEFDEAALFHIFNRVKSAGNFVLMTSRSFPASWSVSLPDLASRLKLAHVVELHEPDDALLSAIIIKLFADRQLEVSPPLLNYLVSRMERSMETATRLVNWIDREALAQRRKINRGLAAEALKSLETGK